jgi:hypothetical protein
MTDPAKSPHVPIPLAAVLELVAMQLEVAMQHAAAEVERLSVSVASFSAIGTSLAARLRETKDATLADQAAAIESEAHRALTAMQYHDQLSQRVMHVRDALGDVHDELLAGGNPDWGALLAKMRAHYTMEDERRLFDLVLGKLPAGATHRDEDALPSSVELF